MAEQDIKQQVANLIRETRKEKGLTQKELGAKLGIGEFRVNRYENGKTNPTIETLQEIFAALGATIHVVVKR
ncbi:MAG: XRE family transcriptional regulator [Pedobacter sp.]|nr:MAG: XRE family transcriptional regulator [Pedobacter sp.]